MRSTLIDAKKFVEKYVAGSGRDFFGNGFIKKKYDGSYEMYIPGYTLFYAWSYDTLMSKIVKIELGKKNPLWKSNEELHIWYDLNCVE